MGLRQRQRSYRCFGLGKVELGENYVGREEWTLLAVWVCNAKII
jgi:hypothetical protein